MRLFVLFAALLALVAPVFAGETMRDINKSFALDEKDEIRLDLPVAEVDVVGTDGESVEVEFMAMCKRERDCEEVLSELDFQSHGSRTTLRVDLVGYPKWGKGRVELEGVVRVPRTISLDIELGVGELEIKEFSGDLRVELGVGEINAWIKKATTRSVTLDAGVGEVELYGADQRLEGRRSMLVGSEAHWDEGPGQSRVFLEVGVGEISVWME